MCDYTCTKYLLFFFNFLFWILGLIITALGAWALADPDFLENIGIKAVDNSALTEVASKFYVHRNFTSKGSLDFLLETASS